MLVVEAISELLVTGKSGRHIFHGDDLVDKLFIYSSFVEVNKCFVVEARQFF